MVNERRAAYASLPVPEPNGIRRPVGRNGSPLVSKPEARENLNKMGTHHACRLLAENLRKFQGVRGHSNDKYALQSPGQNDRQLIALDNSSSSIPALKSKFNPVYSQSRDLSNSQRRRNSAESARPREVIDHSIERKQKRANVAVERSLPMFQMSRVMDQTRLVLPLISLNKAPNRISENVFERRSKSKGLRMNEVGNRLSEEGFCSNTLIVQKSRLLLQNDTHSYSFFQHKKIRVINEDFNEYYGPKKRRQPKVKFLSQLKPIEPCFEIKEFYFENLHLMMETVLEVAENQDMTEMAKMKGDGLQIELPLLKQQSNTDANSSETGSALVTTLNLDNKQIEVDATYETGE